MTKFTKTMLLVLTSGVLLASCGGNASSSSMGEGDSSVSEEGNSSRSVLTSEEDSSFESEDSLSTPVEESYVIRVQAIPGVQITADKERAVKGEIVTLTIEVEEGYALEGVYANSTKLSINGKTAQFAMPNRSVTITASVSVTGDVTLQGDISSVLEETEAGSGLYVARGIKVSTDARFSYVVAGKALSSLDLDPNRCFANLGFGSGNVSGYKMNLKVAGGATYDFYFDSNANPAQGRCYVIKTSQDVLPSDPNSLYGIVDGQVREYTLNPAKLASISYKDSVNDVDYTWSKGEYSSLATVKTYDGSASKGIKYVKVEDGVETVVDTYLEGIEREKTYHKTNINYRAYSGRYGIVKDESLIEFGHFQKEEADVYMDYAIPSKNLEAIRYEIYDGYFGGFSTDSSIGTDGLGQFDIKINSVKTDEGFAVTLASYREIDTSTSSTSGVVEKNFYKYDATLNFDAAGAPLSGSYLAKTYNTSEYDWSTHTLRDGAVGTKIHDIEYAFGYEEQLDVVVDLSQYLSSGISASIRDKELGDEYADKNAILLRSSSSSAGAVTNYTTLSSANLSMDEDGFFLDRDNYTVVSSSDPAVIGKTAWGYLPLKKGKTTLTYGNPAVADAPRFEVEVEVVFNVYIRGFWLYTADDSKYSLDDSEGDASTMLLTAGHKHAWAVIATGCDETGSSSGIGNLPYEFTATVKGSKYAEYVKLSYGRSTRDINNTLIVDTTGMPSFDEDYLNFSITIDCDAYLPGNSATQFSLHLYRNTGFTPVGSWVYAKEDGTLNTAITADIRDFDMDTLDQTTLSSVNVNGTTYYFALDMKDGGGWNAYYSSAYVTDASKRNVGYVEVVELASEFGHDHVLGIYLEANDSKWSGQEEFTGNTVILGYAEEDEGFYINMEYAAFYPAE